ncbi:MAG: trypsin-like serine protease [Methyloversatilis discipulorum]|nr:trypsin-like serine protease [Methyloversatilis discipulorum]
MRSAFHNWAIVALLALSTQAHALNSASTGNSYVHLGTIGTGGLDGVLIAPNWVLTAGHVAQTGITFSSNLGSATVDAAYRVPGFGFPANDLALLHLSSAIDADSFPTLNADVIDNDSAAEGLPVTIAVTAQSGTQSHVYTTVDAAFDEVALEGDSTATVWYLATGSAANGSPYLQGGDSGGALFAGQVGSSQSLLIGIASATDGSLSYFVQPGAYREWLDATLAASGQRALWNVSAVPEPSAAWLLCAGLAVLAWRRRLV